MAEGDLVVVLLLLLLLLLLLSPLTFHFFPNQVVEITNQVLESASAAGCREAFDNQLVSGENFFLQALEALQKGKQIPAVKRDALILFMLNQVISNIVQLSPI